MKPSERRERRRLRLKELIEQKFEGSQIAFSNKAGVPATLVSRYLSGLKGIGEDMRNKIEENTGFLGWLDNQDDSSAYSGAEIEKTPLVSPGDSRLPIKRALFKLSAGVSGYEIEYENGESDPIFMSHNWFKKNNFRPGKLIAISVQGRSMEPKMYDGDLVIVNTESTIPKDGVVFAINYEGEMVIKRMKRDSGQWFITSDNPDKVRFGDKLCTENCFLLGEVVYLQTETI